MTVEPRPAPVLFYFDFISPFGFLASLRVDALAAKYGREADWRSMLTGISVLKVMGLKPIPETPLKGPYALRDAERYCRRHGIALSPPLGPDRVQPRPLAAGRAFHWLRRHDPERAKPVAKSLLRAHWQEGVDIGTPETVTAIAASEGVDKAALGAGFDSGEAALLLRAAVDESLEAGAFGSPFFIVDGEPFFGLEKMELMEEWLATGGW